MKIIGENSLFDNCLMGGQTCNAIVTITRVTELMPSTFYILSRLKGVNCIVSYFTEMGI